jgi:hypothetical protein
VHEFGLPDPSTAWQVTVVAPTGNVPPDGGEQSKLAMPHGSDAPAAYVTTAPPGLVASTVLFVLQVTCGGIVSTTVTVKLQLLELPALSLALQTTLLVPNLNPVPEGGVQVTGTGPSQASIAVAV